MPNHKEEIEIWTEHDLRVAISRTQNHMQQAKKAGADIEEVHSKILDGLRALDSNNKHLARDNLIEAKLKLTEAIDRLKWQMGYFSYIARIYAVPSILYASLLMIVFICLLWHFQDKALIMISTPQVTTVPIWSLLVAGFGSTVQILFGICSDLRGAGVIRIYKRSWFWSLSFISLGLGFAMYLTFQCGLLALNFTIDTSTKSLPMLLCFIAGYATDWMRERLSKVMESL
jgi:hypothetical protein